VPVEFCESGNAIFRKAPGGPFTRLVFRPKSHKLPSLKATYDALMTEDCGLSAGILSAHAEIYNRIFPAIVGQPIEN
jgi:hypothetical protein